MRTRGSLLWIATAVAALLAVAVPVSLIAVNASSASDIPTVSDITAEETGSGVEFGWTDPGLLPSDAYLVEAEGEAPSIQSSPEFVVAASAGDRICVTVTVNRDGRTGSPSREKCVQVAQ